MPYRSVAASLCLGIVTVLLALNVLRLGSDAPAAAPRPNPALAPTTAQSSLPSPPAQPSAPVQPSPPVQASRPGEVADPVTITIPSIDVEASILPVGLNPDGSMEVPEFGFAAWYTEGPKPGAPGPAVVVAHVDSRSGPDVFYRLNRLRPGEEVRIARADGSVGMWTVTGQEQTPKDALPADRIWNDTTTPVLRLITCGGIFDRSIGHYTDNIIVYAEPRWL